MEVDDGDGAAAARRKRTMERGGGGGDDGTMYDDDDDYRDADDASSRARYSWHQPSAEVLQHALAPPPPIVAAVEAITMHTELLEARMGVAEPGESAVAPRAVDWNAFQQWRAAQPPAVLAPHFRSADAAAEAELAAAASAERKPLF
jgi:hypothetical protein